MRELSKLLFNAQHRLAVASVFAGDSDAALTYEQVADRCGVSRSVVHKDLQVLVHIDAVQRVELGRSVHYLRAPSAFWLFLEDLLSRIDSEEANR